MFPCSMPARKSSEDDRRDNFMRGQALLDQKRRELDEQRRKEEEEHAKREAVRNTWASCNRTFRS